MKCVVWKSAGTSPSRTLINAFDAKLIDGLYIGELNLNNIKNCKKSFTVWKPKNRMLTATQRAVIAKVLGITEFNFDSNENSMPWILDTYPDQQ